MTYRPMKNKFLTEHRLCNVMMNTVNSDKLKVLEKFAGVKLL